MTNFSFFNPVKIIFGKNTIPQIAQEIPTDKTVMIVYGGGSIKQNGVYNQVVQALKGRKLVEFAGIEANPTYETCLKGIELIKRENVGFLLAVGGGSVIDASKFMALGSQAEGDLWDIIAKARHPKTALPLGCILTLPATGTEMNDRAVVTNLALQDKNALRTPLVYPLFSVLDPETTFTLPVRQIGNGVVDTFVHTTEQYLTYPAAAPLQDYFAESILKVLVENGEKALADPTNYEVRANLMWASTWALNGWIAQGVPEDWATHQIGHEITAFYGLDHAQTLAIVLPGVLEVLMEDKAEKLAQMGERVFGITSGSLHEKAVAAIQALESFFIRMGVKTRLSDYGLGKEAVETVCFRNRERNWIMGERQNITPDVVKTILSKRL